MDDTGIEQSVKNDITVIFLLRAIESSPILLPGKFIFGESRKVNSARRESFQQTTNQFYV